MNGQRIKPLDAPTMRMIAISSRLVKVASFIVLVMIKKETMMSMTISARDTMLTMFLAVMKPWA